MSHRFTLKTLLQLLTLVTFGGAFAVFRLAPSVARLGDILLISAIGLAVFTERRRIAAFRTSESKLRALIASMDDVILILDRDGMYKEIVPTNPSLLYRPAQEMTGRRIADFFPPDETSFFLSRIARALDERETVQVDYSLRIDDRTVWFSASVSPLNESTVIWVARDITQRKSDAEATLRSSEERYRSVFDQANDIIFTLSSDGVVTSVNPAFERILGWSREEWIGRPFSGLLAGEVRTGAEKRFAEAARNGSLPLTQAVALTKNGSRVILEATLVEQVLNETSVGFLGIARDVTLRERALAKLRRSEQRVRDSEERFRLLARATSDAIYDTDLATEKVWRGDGYESLFGYTAGELGPTIDAWRVLVHPDDLGAVELSYREALGSGEMSWSGEYRFRRADGNYANILDNAYIVRDAQKRPVRMLGAMVDITERKQLEQELEQSKRVTSLGRIAASIAHEVNNVLMGIQPNAEVLQRRGPVELRHVSENIMQAVRRGKRVTDEILRFTRPADPALECVNVPTLLHRWEEEIRPLLGGSVRLDISVEDPETYALVDPLQIGQVFTNLALNARDAMQERGGCIRIRAELAKSWGAFRFAVVKTPDRFVHFSVHDDGSGITEAQLAHIFEPLFTTKKGGIGLGLAISYQVVSRHNGHIFVESPAGEGTTFHVFLPTTLPVLHERELKTSPTLAIRRVLLVEDEPAVSSGIAMLLEMEGVLVEVVSAGREACAAIERFAPDAVVLDIGLPDVDGITVYGDIHGRWPSLPVLFSSGHGDSAQLEHYLARPNVGFILKPYDFDAVRQKLAEIARTPIVN
jgi:PAS domain S-box-containing protein